MNTKEVNIKIDNLINNIDDDKIKRSIIIDGTKD